MTKLTVKEKEELNKRQVEENADEIDNILWFKWQERKSKPEAVAFIIHSGNARNIKAVAERLHARYTDEWFGGWKVYLDHKEDSQGYWTAARLLFPGENHAY